MMWEVREWATGARGSFFPRVFVLTAFLLSGCTDVANLIDSEESDPGAFSSLDKETKNKFAKIEGLNPSEPITLKVELFEFSSIDTQGLTNLTQQSFDPVLEGAEQLSGGIIQFKNGFTTTLKLINSKSCGKFSLSDLVVLLCPDTAASSVSGAKTVRAYPDQLITTNVAFTSLQQLSFLLGPSIRNLFDLTLLAKLTPEALQSLEDAIRKALSNDLESTKRSTTEAAGDDKISQAKQEAETPGSVTGAGSTDGGSGGNQTGGQGGGSGAGQQQTPEGPPAPKYGARPTAHVENAVTISDATALTTAQVTFAGDFIVLAYTTQDPGPPQRRIRIYSKDLSNGLQLLADRWFDLSIASIDALGVSSEGLDKSTDNDLIWVAGLPTLPAAGRNNRLVIEIPFNKTTRTFGEQKSVTIPKEDFDIGGDAGSQYGVFYKHQGVIHRIPAGRSNDGAPSTVRFVTSGTTATGADYRALFEEGDGNAMHRVMWAVLPYMLFSFELIDVMYKDGEPRYYFGEYRHQNDVNTYKHAMWFYNLSTSGTGEEAIHMDYGGGGIRIDYVDYLKTALGNDKYFSIRDASYFDSDSNILGLSYTISGGDGTPYVGTARLDGGRIDGYALTWTYMIPTTSNWSVLDVAFDIYETGNLVVVLVNGTTNQLKLIGYQLSY